MMEVGNDTRRSFLSKLLGGTLLAGFGSMLAAMAAYLFPSAEVSSALGPRRVKVGNAASIPLGSGKLLLVEEEPVWVVHTPSGFVGMSALCSHKGCIVNWEEKREIFSCPCHDGHFDQRGNVVSGLPLRPLRHVRVGLIQGELYVSRGDEHPA